MTSVLVSIDRSGMPGAPAPLVISGDEDEHPLGLASYQEPGRVVRVTYMPDHPDVHGSSPIGASFQQGLISFSVFPQAVDEAGARTLMNELAAALGQFSYTVTTTVGNAPAQTWSAVMGSLEQTGGRSLEDLDASDPLYTVTIPVYPIAS